ncbi:endophilin-A-like [Artemia franciscana]|uniref:endophilin-A-like n=1 Tax=Artemia franciscana TaxID=6661 RepID=UPI0032DAA4CD
MAFAGLKKQINKANQYVTEKMGAAEGTKLDEDFCEMEKRTDITYELVEELQLKTKEFLQPNPNARAKMAAVKSISKLSGQAKAATYPQPEGVLGEAMVTFGRKLGDDNQFAEALIEMGESMKQIADVKYSLDDNVKQNFLEPLHHLQSKDLKEVMHHRKKLHGRRLDYDCKKRKQHKASRLGQPGSYGSPARSPSPSLGSSVSEDEIRQAEEKFAESLHLAQMGMHNILDNDVEQITQLTSFAESLLEYHTQCTQILQDLTQTLHDKRNEVANRPKSEFVPKTLADLHITSELSSSHNLHIDGQNGRNVSSPVNPSAPPANNNIWDDPFGSSKPNSSPAASPSINSPHASKGPSCVALYDFSPENPGELGFKEGDTIKLVSRIDHNWLEGSIDGRTGYFPFTYVQIIVPLP